MHCAPTGARSEECVRAYDLAVRSRYCWGTAAIEITGIAHGSGGWVGDGFALFPPAFPSSSALSGQKPVLQFFPLEWERANLQQFSLQGDWYCFVPSGSRVAEATRALWSFSVHYIKKSVKSVREGRSLTVKQFQKLLGLMSAASNVIPFGLLYMRSLQWWLKTKGFSPVGNLLRMIKVTRRCLRALGMEETLVFLSQGLVLGAPCRRVMLATDASLTGRGAVMSDHPAHGLPDLRDRHVCDT